MVASTIGSPGTTAPSRTITVPSSRATSRILDPGLPASEQSPARSVSRAGADGSYVKVNPETCGNWPPAPGIRSTARSSSTWKVSRGTSPTTKKLPNGAMSQVSPVVISPAGITASLRMPPPFCTAASGTGVPKSAARLVAAARSASAWRLPWLVEPVRTMARRPSRSTSLWPITSASTSATAAARGSITLDCTVGSGVTSKLTPTERPVWLTMLPSPSKVTVSSPMQR